LKKFVIFQTAAKKIKSLQKEGFTDGDLDKKIETDIVRMQGNGKYKNSVRKK